MGGESRPVWGKEIEFILACIGNAVGLGNLWRFPYLCYESGGGAFLIPYFIMLIFCGIPLLYMEYGMGQMTRKGPIGALQVLQPITQGAGMATVMLSFLLATYYNVILTWSMYFMVNTFSKELPWSHCNNTFNSEKCWVSRAADNSSLKPVDSASPVQEFFERGLLQQTNGLETFGGMRLELLGLLFFAWVLVYFCLWKGIRWTGKVVYFTATFPYVVIIVMIIRGMTLPGAMLGVDFFINPKWELIKEPKVWVNAAAQNFNSIGIAFGSMIAFSSYNKVRNPILRDVLSVCVVNSLTSIMAGFAVFSVLGNIAYNQGKNVTDVATGGAGLVFTIYPEVFNTMPNGVAQLLAFVFFMMIVCLAIDSQFAAVEVVITTINDHFGNWVTNVLKRKEVLVLLVCVVAFACGLPVIFQGGIYYFTIIDNFSSGISLMLIALIEVVAVAWLYGAHRFAKNLKEIVGTKPNIFFIACWFVLSPLLIGGIMIFNWVQYSPISYGSYTFPEWGLGIGWALAGLSLICIPIGAINALVKAPGDSLSQRLKYSFSGHLTKPDDDAIGGNMQPNVNIAYVGDEKKLPADFTAL